MQNFKQMWSDLGLNISLHDELISFLENKYANMILSQGNRPEKMKYFDETIHNSHSGRVSEIIEYRKNGAKMIGTFCIYVPEELILAVSAIPVALCGGTSFTVPYAERRFPRDICPLIKSTLGMAFSKTCPYSAIEDMGVGETTCDAKKKTWDILSEKSRFHIIELPQKKNARNAELWRSEVNEFKESIENLTNKKITFDNLLDSVKLMNRKRRLLQELNEYRKLSSPPISGIDSLVVMQAALNDDIERFCNMLGELITDVDRRAREGISAFPEKPLRVVVTGCPSVMGNWQLHHIIETSGAAVVCDESCTGTRYYENFVDECEGTVNELVGEVADRYFKINCSCFTPNNDRIDHILELARKFKADAVVQNVLQYCHTYNIEAMRIARALKTAGIPSIVIESDYSEENEGQVRTRIQALLESVVH